MDSLIEAIEYRGFNINIHYDECDMNPRIEFDNVGHMICFHSRYDLGDKHNFNNPNDFLQFIKEETPPIILSLYLYDHSGITISTAPFSCPWDSGQVGWIYCTQEQINDEWNGDIEKAKNYLISEVKEYDNYLTGNIYGYIIEPIDRNKSINCDESCWGFFGYDHEKSGLLDSAKSNIRYSIKDYKEQCIADHKRKIEMNIFMRNCWAY